MNISKMRDAIRNAYPTKSWSERVDKMGSNQIVAIYYNFLRGGKFGQPSLRRGNGYHQITIEEFLKREKESML